MNTKFNSKSVRLFVLLVAFVLSAVLSSCNIGGGDFISSARYGVDAKSSFAQTTCSLAGGYHNASGHCVSK